MSDTCLSPAAVRLTLRYPFWSEIFYSMTVVEDATIETAATDGRKLWVSPKFWATLTIDEQVAVVAHELGHKIFLHCTRQGSRDGEMWNWACDYAINGLLKDNGFVLPEPHLYEKKYHGQAAEAIYADLMKEQKNGASKPKGGMRDVVAADLTPEEAEKVETEVKALVERAIANAKARGTVPVGMEAGVVDVYKASVEPWFNRLHRYMQSLSSSEYNWARLNRRTLRSHGFFSPLHLSEALGDVALFIDTSGSCFDAAEQANFAGHLNAILAEARPKHVHLYYFDARVYPGQSIEAGELDVSTRPVGGGGTAFEPIFAQLEDDGIEPEVCIILTDLYGSFPHSEPSYPVVWACTSDQVAPFGETMKLGC